MTEPPVGPGLAGLSRRSLLGAAAAAGLGAMLPGPWGSPARASGAQRVVGYGSLVQDPARRLALPAGFTYAVLAEAGVSRLDSGEFTPGCADGSCSFPGELGRVALVVNHEISPGPGATSPHKVPAPAGYTYDPGCPGGTTTIVLDRSGAREREYVSLAGTDHNCAGGPTPWGTWLSCEESELRAGVEGRTKDHGYVFEVDPLDPQANRDPQPIKAFGRFRHEAVAVDPVRGQVYLTEDAEFPSGLLYRWTPPPGRLLGRGVLRGLGVEEGTLEAMVVHKRLGGVVADLSTAPGAGVSYAASWVPVPDRDARELSVRKQFAYSYTHKGAAKQGAGPTATRVHKLEGAWWGDGGVYLNSSFADPATDASPAAHNGQVWFLDPLRTTITLRLRLVAPAEAGQSYDGPDNITLCPYGGVVVAEDGKGPQFLWGLSPDGRTYPIAREEVRAGAGFTEFAGVNFSPDRKTLFANAYSPGTVYAIRGPWRNQF